MTTYRLAIRFQGRLLGQFDAAGPSSLTDVNVLANSLQQTPGYELELFVARGERRILESRPDSIRVLSAEQVFAPVKTWMRTHKES